MSNKGKSLYNPFEYHKRETLPVKNIGGDNVPIVISDVSYKDTIRIANIKDSGYIYNKDSDSFKPSQLAADYIYIWGDEFNLGKYGNINFIVYSPAWERSYLNNTNVFPFFFDKDYLLAKTIHPELNFVQINISDINYIKDLKKDSKIVLVLKLDNNIKINTIRTFFNILVKDNIKLPVILHKLYLDKDEESFMLKSSGDFGSLLVDGFGDGIWIYNEKVNAKIIKNTSFGILQACRVRTSKTEYISCPTCGRTLFDIQKTVAEIKKRTKHLKGIKIAIMGCIVNGLGEMADADYGYIGGAKGKVNLYMNKELMKQNIPEEKAVDELLKLIKKRNEK